jgi:8-oxo-dGTP pyrophosphatase MutT (NUDIX family)
MPDQVGQSLIRFARNLLLPKTAAVEPSGLQFGAIPYRIVEGHVVFLMITSRRSANWVFPKGSPMEGLTPWETAAEEAFEEAGVRGEIEHEPIGSYLNPRNDDPTRLVRIELYPLLVTEQLDAWREEAQRFRHWALLPQVRSLLASKEAARIAGDLHRRIVSSC